MVETGEEHAPPKRLPNGHGSETDEGKRATLQTGATLFPDLVRAHYRREAERRKVERDGGGGSTEAQKEFEKQLEKFETKVGEIDSVYWCTRRASAVALTVGKPRGLRNPFTDTETVVRLHRVTDWVTTDCAGIADLLHDCDLLAIRVGEVLRGTSERITMRWIFGVQQHLLGFFERNEAASSPLRRPWTGNGKTASPKRVHREEQRLVEAQRKELAKIEQYYLRIAAKAGRIVYVSGMIVGALLIALLCTLVAVGLAVWYPEGWVPEVRNVLLCTGAGAVGALTSVLSRMNSIGGAFTVDVEVGRPLLRRLGLYKPFVGAVFGVAVYFVVGSGLLTTQTPSGKNGLVFFYGIVAFLAGFSERFTGVIFGGAEQLVSGGLGDTGAAASDGRARADADATAPAEPPVEARAREPAKSA